MTGVKICGIATAEALDAAVRAGATHFGFVFHPDSPRHVTAEQGRVLSNKTPSNLTNVGLFVDPAPADIETVLTVADLDMIQLHGDESPQDVQKIRSRFGLPVMKAIRLAARDDLEQIPAYGKVSDWLLFDTKSKNAQGGTGQSFDWTILENFHPMKPWMLAGGLTADNVGRALSILKPDAVDVSSGVEDSPGVKNPTKIKIFIDIVKNHG